MTSESGADFAVRLRGVSKAFGRTAVLRGVDLDVSRGETLSLLGANGSGKTTLIRVLATLMKPDSGEMRIAGFDPGRAGGRVRKAIGVVTHDPLLYDDLTARENLRFSCRMFGMDRGDERVERVSGLVGMESRLDQRVGTMSHGTRKRFSIARALLHDPSILLMDEPETGLDREGLDLLDAVICDRARSGRTVIMTTHDTERAAVLGDRVVTLANGRIADVTSGRRQ